MSAFLTAALQLLAAVGLVALMMLIRQLTGRAAARRRSACEQKGCNFGCGGVTDSKHP